VKTMKKFTQIAFCLIFCTLMDIGLAFAKADLINEGHVNRPFAYTSSFDLNASGQQIYFPVTAPFCQIFTSRYNFWRLRAEIVKFSTFKLGPCPADSFAKLSIASILAQIKTIGHTAHAYKNGPSYYLMDSNLSPLNREFLYIGPLKFFAQSTSSVSIYELLFNPILSKKGIPTAYFSPFTVHEDIYYIWNKGATIHTLIPPDKKGYYVMTSYSKMIDPDADKSNITDKVEELTLPEGWKYESRILEKPLIVRTQPAKKFAHQIVFDQLQNFYHFIE